MDTDGFKEAAQAAGMTYIEYATHRHRIARKRCGLDGGPQHQTLPPKALSGPPSKQSKPIPTDITRYHPAVLNPAILTAETEIISHLTSEVQRLQDKIDEIRRWYSRPPCEVLDIPKTKSLRELADEVCAKHGINLEILRGNCRSKGISLARMEFHWRCRVELGRSWGDMGRFTLKDHTSCLYGCRRYEELIKLKAQGYSPVQGMKRYWHLIDGSRAAEGELK